MGTQWQRQGNSNKHQQLKLCYYNSLWSTISANYRTQRQRQDALLALVPMSLSQLRSRLILTREAEMQANESIERMSRSRDMNDMVSEEKCKFFSFCTHFSYESLTLCFLQN